MESKFLEIVDKEERYVSQISSLEGDLKQINLYLHEAKNEVESQRRDKISVVEVEKVRAELTHENGVLRDEVIKLEKKIG